MTAQMLSSAPTYTRSAEAVAAKAAANAESDEDSDDDDDDDVAGPPAPALTPEERARRTAQRLELPVSHEAALKGHSKAVIALSVDPGGGRVASGGSDYKVKLYDFGGMDKHHRSFREFEAEEGNIVVALSHSPSGDRFLCCTASAQPKVFDRDGIEVCHFARGDPYIRDMKQTKGHITNVTAGQWHPSEKNTLAATVYVVSVNGANALMFFRLLFDSGYAHVHFVVEAAHGTGNAVSCVEFHEDGHLLATRGTDDCVKLWDARKFSQPLKVFTDVATHMETSNVAFSPNGRVLAVGLNANPKSSDCGVMRFYNVYGADTEPELQIGLAGPGASVVRVLWHTKLRQILATTTAGYTK
eukprot:11537-Heterococcus_DN1.PRE.1